MDKDNTKSTINELLKVINEQKFTQIINVIDLDKYVRKLTAYKFLQILIIAQINEIESLLATYKICSPYHLLMNWTFTVTGIAIFVGAICLHQFWSDKKLTRIATAFFVLYGLGYTISRIIPADVNFLWHTLVALPGMVVQIPALIMIGFAIRKKWPKLSLWTFFCALLNTCVFILLFFQPFIDLPGGLLQRTLCGSVYLWMIITALVLWQKNT